MGETQLMMPRRTASARRPLGLLFGRVGLVAAASVLVWALFGALGVWTAFPLPLLVGVVAMLPVNVASLIWVRRLVHDDGGRLRDLIGFSAKRLGVDVLWGLLWLVVLYVPFAFTVMGVMALLHGDAMFVAFETVFFDPATMPVLAPWLVATLVIVSVVSFAPLNAPVEELVYRGYGQRGLARRLPVWAAIVVSAALYGLQHAFYAASLDSVIVYVCAFFVWGVGSGVIAHRQGRLMPIIVAHVLVNLAMTAPALALLFLPSTIGVS